MPRLRSRHDALQVAAHEGGELLNRLETVVNALIKHSQKLPHELYRSLTWDRGKEMADHRRFTLATDIKV